MKCLNCGIEVPRAPECPNCHHRHDPLDQMLHESLHEVDSVGAAFGFVLAILIGLGLLVYFARG